VQRGEDVLEVAPGERGDVAVALAGMGIEEDLEERLPFVDRRLAVGLETGDAAALEFLRQRARVVEVARAGRHAHAVEEEPALEHDEHRLALGEERVQRLRQRLELVAEHLVARRVGARDAQDRGDAEHQLGAALAQRAFGGGEAAGVVHAALRSSASLQVARTLSETWRSPRSSAARAASVPMRASA
jgi:hypothetical protein